MSLIYINSYQFAAAAPPSGYDPDAAAYIARVEGASGDNQALETAVKDAINAFVVGCKADGIWNAVKASCILAGARTLNGALQPLTGAAPTPFAFVEADYNRKAGLVGNGSTKYLDSNRASNADPQNSVHIAVYLSTAGTTSTNRAHLSSQYISQNNDLTDIVALNDNRLILRSRNPNGTSANILASPAGSFTGLMGTSRASSSNYNIRRNGITSNVSNALEGISYAPSSTNYAVFARMGSPPSLYSNARIAFYSIGEHLDLALLDARVTTLINAFAAAIP